MGLEQETELSATETDSLLGRHETGVLALASDDEPYAIPISFGYDADDRRFFLRLVSTPESEKRAFLEAEPAARLVVYEEEEETATYRSVVVTGTLEAISTEDMTVERIEQYGRAKRPLFEIWGESKRDLDIALYELDADQISGREIVIERDD